MSQYNARESEHLPIDSQLPIHEQMILCLYFHVLGLSESFLAIVVNELVKLRSWDVSEERDQMLSTRCELTHLIYDLL